MEDSGFFIGIINFIGVISLLHSVRNFLYQWPIIDLQSYLEHQGVKWLAYNMCWRQDLNPFLPYAKVGSLMELLCSHSTFFVEEWVDDCSWYISLHSTLCQLRGILWGYRTNNLEETRKLRPKEVNWLAQGHVSNVRFAPSSLVPEPCLLTLKLTSPVSHSF